MAVRLRKLDLFNFEGLGKGSQVFKACRGEFFNFLEVVDIVLNCHPGFDNLGIFEDFNQRAKFHYRIKPKEKGLVGGG